MYLEEACDAKIAQLTSLSLRENIQRQLEKAVEEVKRLEEILSLLQNNPETARILELMGRR